MNKQRRVTYFSYYILALKLGVQSWIVIVPLAGLNASECVKDSAKFTFHYEHVFRRNT